MDSAFRYQMRRRSVGWPWSVERRKATDNSIDWTGEEEKSTMSAVEKVLLRIFFHFSERINDDDIVDLALGHQNRGPSGLYRILHSKSVRLLLFFCIDYFMNDKSVDCTRSGHMRRGKRLTPKKSQRYRLVS